MWSSDLLQLSGDRSELRLRVLNPVAPSVGSRSAFGKCVVALPAAHLLHVSARRFRSGAAHQIDEEDTGKTPSRCWLPAPQAGSEVNPLESIMMSGKARTGYSASRSQDDTQSPGDHRAPSSRNVRRTWQPSS
jgi:hypothetical protein